MSKAIYSILFSVFLWSSMVTQGHAGDLEDCQRLCGPCNAEKSECLDLCQKIQKICTDRHLESFRVCKNQNCEEDCHKCVYHNELNSYNNSRTSESDSAKDEDCPPSLGALNAKVDEGKLFKCPMR